MMLKQFLALLIIVLGVTLTESTPRGKHRHHTKNFRDIQNLYDTRNLRHTNNILHTKKFLKTRALTLTPNCGKLCSNGADWSMLVDTLSQRVIYDKASASLALVSNSSQYAAVFTKNFPGPILVRLVEGNSVVWDLSTNVVYKSNVTITNGRVLLSSPFILQNALPIVQTISQIIQAPLEVVPQSTPIVWANFLNYQLNPLPLQITSAIWGIMSKMVGTPTGLFDAPMLYSLFYNVLELLRGVQEGKISAISVSTDLSVTASNDQGPMFSIMSRGKVVQNGVMVGDIPANQVGALPGSVTLSPAGLVVIDYMDPTTSVTTGGAISGGVTSGGTNGAGSSSCGTTSGRQTGTSQSSGNLLTPVASTVVGLGSGLGLSSVTNPVGGVVNSLGGTVSGLLGGLGGAGGLTGGLGLSGVTGTVGGLTGGLGGLTSGLGGLTGGLTGTVGGLTGGLGGLTGLTGTAGGLTGGLGGLTGGLAGTIGGLTGVVGGLTGGLGGLTGGLGGLTGGLGGLTGGLNGGLSGSVSGSSSTTG